MDRRLSLTKNSSRQCRSAYKIFGPLARSVLEENLQIVQYVRLCTSYWQMQSRHKYTKTKNTNTQRRKNTNTQINKFCNMWDCAQGMLTDAVQTGDGWLQKRRKSGRCCCSDRPCLHFAGLQIATRDPVKCDTDNNNDVRNVALLWKWNKFCWVALWSMGWIELWGFRRVSWVLMGYVVSMNCD